MSSNNEELEYASIFFVSRNKDNRNVKNFKQRSKSFLTGGSLGGVYNKFYEFAREGLDNELSRMYLSVNNRDIELANKNLVHYLIDNPSTPPHKIYQKLVSFANKSDCATTKKWMFDFDGEKEPMEEFVLDIRECVGEGVGIGIFQTKSGYNITVEHGFDTRELLEKWSDVGLHRDGSILLAYMTTEEAEEFE